MDSKMMQLVAVTEREVGEDKEKKSFWTRIGVAFENNDGSYNLRFEYLPARMAETTIQMRPFTHRAAADAAPATSSSEGPTDDAVEPSERPRRQPPARRRNGQE
jgi:hypothetical protein